MCCNPGLAVCVCVCSFLLCAVEIGGSCPPLELTAPSVSGSGMHARSNLGEFPLFLHTSVGFSALFAIQSKYLKRFLISWINAKEKHVIMACSFLLNLTKIYVSVFSFFIYYFCSSILVQILHLSPLIMVIKIYFGTHCVSVCFICVYRQRPSKFIERPRPGVQMICSSFSAGRSEVSKLFSHLYLFSFYQ